MQPFSVHYWREHRPRIDYCFDGDRLCPVSTIGQTLDDLLGIADPDAALPQIDPDARRRLTALVNAAATAL